MIDLGRERKVSKVVIDWAAGRYATDTTFRYQTMVPTGAQ